MGKGYKGWLDWREIELHNDWGLREKTDAMGEVWNDDADSWDSRWKSDEEFTKAQAAALELLPTDTVLDLCCGAGPLTVNVAPRVAKVIAQDYGRDMLAHVRENCEARGVSNVETLQGNWYSMKPGVDLPVCDVAITRWSPAQGDILKMSCCAKRQCYSLMTCEPEFAEGGFQNSGYWCRSTVDESQNTTPRPCNRKYGFNVHFNLLYDHGANPTISYVTKSKTTTTDTKEELVGKLMKAARSPKGAGEVPAGLLALLERGMRQDESGIWVHEASMKIAVLGWDPRDVRY